MTSPDGPADDAAAFRKGSNPTCRYHPQTFRQVVCFEIEVLPPPGRGLQSASPPFGRPETDLTDVTWTVSREDTGCAQ